MRKDFKECLKNKVGFKGYGLSEEKQKSESVMDYEGESFTLKHGKLPSNFFTVVAESHSGARNRVDVI